MIKIFTGLPTTVETEINDFLKTNVVLNDIKLSESQGEEGFGVTVLLSYNDAEDELFTIDDIKSKANELLTKEVKKVIKENKKCIDLEIKHYDEYLHNVFNSLLYSSKHPEFYKEYIDFLKYCEDNDLKIHTTLLGFLQLKFDNGWESHFNTYYKTEENGTTE